MIHLQDELQNVTSVAIAGHVRPDGDCVGSCLGLYHYIRGNWPHIAVQVYLEPFSEVFSFLKDSDLVCASCELDQRYDLFFALDSGDKERLGAAVKYFETAGRTLCVDHHISNTGYADENYIVPDASSTSELIYGLMEENCISRAAAECIYVGIVHDTGVFQYSSTSPRTMEIAGRLMTKGIDFTTIIDETFYQKTYGQNQILGKALQKSRLMLDGKCIVSCISQEDMRECGVTTKDLDGIVSQLRVTKGVEVAVFLYETSLMDHKISMRATGHVNVSRIAAGFGGGGHVKAAGCSMAGEAEEVVAKLMEQIALQLS